MSTSSATETPFQLNDSRYDPIGTTREERLAEGINVWVLEEMAVNRAVYSPPDMVRRWRCLYTTDGNATGMVGQTILPWQAAGFPVTGAVPSTPAERVWTDHLSRDGVPAQTIAELREWLRRGSFVKAIAVLRDKTGWSLVTAKGYITNLRAEMARDDELLLLAAAEELG